MVHLKSRPRKTVEDYMSLPDDVRVELIEGEFFVTPSPSYRHQNVVGYLYRTLHAFVEPRALGKVCLSPLDVILPSGEVVQPDVLFVSGERLAILQDRVRGIPDLVIEVVSESAPERDRIVKRDVYARNGVDEYWLVELVTQSVEVLTINDTAYTPHGYFEINDTLTSPKLPGLDVPVADIFEE